MFYSIVSRKIKSQAMMACALSLLVSANSLAYEGDATSVPWAGKIPVRVLSVESPRFVNVTFESWPGFWLNFRINVPGIAVPEDLPQSPECERELAAKAMIFAQQFIKDAKQVYIHDMRVVTTTDPDGYAPIFADPGGYLAAALMREGLARADTVDPEEPWCKE
jgi:hypothetical protein